MNHAAPDVQSAEILEGMLELFECRRRVVVPIARCCSSDS